MKHKNLVMKVLGYVPVIPIFLGKLVAELVVDLVHYFFGRRRSVRWPEPTAATSLLHSPH